MGLRFHLVCFSVSAILRIPIRAVGTARLWCTRCAPVFHGTRLGAFFYVLSSKDACQRKCSREWAWIAKDKGEVFRLLRAREKMKSANCAVGPSVGNHSSVRAPRLGDWNVHFHFASANMASALEWLYVLRNRRRIPPAPRDRQSGVAELRRETNTTSVFRTGRIMATVRPEVKFHLEGTSWK